MTASRGMTATLGLARLLVCPACRAPLVEDTETVRRCPVERARYVREAGIWRMLAPSVSDDVASFLRHYREVRRREGWGSSEGAYYRALPFKDTTSRHQDIWNIRALTYRLFLRKVMGPAESEKPGLRILDLGAGNCWLSDRLARRGHEVAAVDINDDPTDGLGAHVHYDSARRFDPVQASFDRLPWPAGAADLAVYNGSFHYSSDYGGTLQEAVRVLAPGGRVVIVDSPLYRRAAAGEVMLRERTEVFGVAYGLDAEGGSHEGFLTPARLDEVGRAVGLSWSAWYPFAGLRGALRPLKNRILRRREQARFPVIVGVSA